MIRSDVIRRLLPRGTAPARGKTPSWTACPGWPPDAFAVAATLANHTGCYARARYTSVSGAGKFFTDKRRAEIRELGLRWRTEAAPAPEVQRAWRKLVSSPSSTDRNDTIMWLLTVADEASTGMGFPRLPGERRSEFADALLVNYEFYAKKSPDLALTSLPNSICYLVDAREACVQPKTVTPQVGVTLRNFSHHLALLPGFEQVGTEWWPTVVDRERSSREQFTLLVVPFPYQVRGDAFVDAGVPRDPEDEQFRYFRVDQSWLRPECSPRVFARDFLDKLCRAAAHEVGPIHAIILPELSLEATFAAKVAKEMHATGCIELFVAGVAKGGENGSLPVNGAYVALLHAGGAIPGWIQAKHHRWCLDSSQIVRYHLGHALGSYPVARWWEQIDVHPRKVSFPLFRPAASLAVLICEDLARIDPVQEVIRAVGPNLVIALLMDGPQLKSRWPARYAITLADDPGSAVLTLTSLGMVTRSTASGESPSRVVALFKSARDDVKELALPDGAHALALTLSGRFEHQRTLDRRDDGGTTEVLHLTAVRPISLGADLPKWIDPPTLRW